MMRDAVGRLTPSIRDVVSYHLGWTDAAGHQTAVKGGKGIRAALATLSAEASWADAVVGAPGGVAVELVHNFSLLHDDLMDGDVERRHRPTAWALWGPSVALLAGDALATLATDVLLRTPSPAAPQAALALCEATAEMIAGQADDLAFEARRSVSVEECMGMSTAKTGALLGCAASIGAILAGAPRRRCGHYATSAGTSEWRSRPPTTCSGSGATRPPLANPPATTSANVRSRCRSWQHWRPATTNRRSWTPCSLTAGLNTGAPTAASGNGRAGDRAAHRPDKHVSTTLAVPGWAPTLPSPLTHEEVARATWLVEACGGREWTAARAKAHLDAALGSLERARLSAVPRRALADLAVYVVERES